MNQISRSRMLKFRTNRRGTYSLYFFLLLFVLSLFAEVIANEKPFFIRYEGTYYFPVVQFYPETTFGGDFETDTDYKDPYILEKITSGDNFVVFPPIPFSHLTIDVLYDHPHPAPPGHQHILGTDDRGRDVLARLIYGLRLSIMFGLAITVFAVILGISLGAIQGYFGGGVDLWMQRFMEIWSSVPELYLLIILTSIFQPNIYWLILILAPFSWMGMAHYIRVEFLRARNLDYIKAAKALGVNDAKIIRKHILPNVLTPVITLLPFTINNAMIGLATLDFLGLGVPPDQPSLGELLKQGKDHIESWWLSVTAFAILVLLLMLLNFVGEALREAFDPRRKGI